MNYQPRNLSKIWSEVPVDYYYKLNIIQNTWHNRKWQVFVNILSGIKPPPKKILDIGCAGGHLTSRVAELFPEAQITGIDVYGPAIVEAQKRFPNLKFIISDVHKMPFANKTFDLVICSETIEHLVDPRKALKEIKRVLKRNGNFLLEMDSGSNLFRLIWVFWVFFGKGRVWKNAHLNPYKLDELESLVTSEGFNIKTSTLSHLGMAISLLASQ